MRVISFIGGRPNIIKAEPIHKSLIMAGFQHQIMDISVIHKPYGKKTYIDLGLPQPVTISPGLLTDNYLTNIKNLSGKIINFLSLMKPNLILVYGDIDPGVAMSLSCLSNNIPVGHIEAGLRNYSLKDTEEINRLIIDRFSTLLFCTSNSAKSNLLKEGFNSENIYIVGNTIIAALRRHLKFASTTVLHRMGLEDKKYGLLTIHREENLTSPDRLLNIFSGIEKIQQETPIIFINYSSTAKALKESGHKILKDFKNVRIVSTLTYHEYLGVLKNASFVITDSSGIQDETTYLGIPCITCRENTHRVDTLMHENNVLVSDNPEKIIHETMKALARKKTDHTYPIEWDLDVGKTIKTTLLNRMEAFYDPITRK